MRRLRAALSLAASIGALAAFAPALAPKLAAQEAPPLEAAAQEAAAQNSPEAPSYTLGGTVEVRPFGRNAGSAGFGTGAFSYGQATSLGLELGASGSRARAAASVEAAILSGAGASDAWAGAGAALLAGVDSAGLILAPPLAAGPAPPTLVEARIRALYLKLDYDWFSLSAGRQVVKYRRGALWSPTDPFTELDLSGISPVRRGSDALRLVFPLGATGAFDLVAAPGADFSKGRYAARLSGLVAGIDGAALAYRDGSAGGWSLGADFKADLILSFNGSVLFTKPDLAAPGIGVAQLGGAWLRAAGGADWSYGNLFLAAEYYYNGGGPGADPTAGGEHNAYAGLSWTLTDYLGLSASLVDGISSGTWTALLVASLDAAQNAVLSAYAKLGDSGSGGAWPSEAGLDAIVKF